MKAISLHLGLNKIDRKHYGNDGTLAGCHKDAVAMQALAKSQKFKENKILLDDKAKAAAVIKAIESAAAKLVSGDSFFLTYSGHGSQVEDVNVGEEKDGLDETWCLYDRMLLDDELASLWAKFKAGVRITVLSDSCHSGTVTRALFRPPGSAEPQARARLLPEALRQTAVTNWASVYRAIQMRTPKEEDIKIKATVLLISGCQDHQLSLDGDDNGLFTETLLEVWDDGHFTGTCKRLRAEIIALMPPEQQPQYNRVGAPNGPFETSQALRPGAVPTPVSPRSRDARRGVMRAVPAAADGETPLDFVLRELEINGLRDPQPDTNIKKFFAEMEKIDQQLGSPSRTAVFRELYNAAFDLRIGFADLINGRYPTPAALAAVAG